MWQKKRRISLALQGGGAHGAFTWGVLDRLLEEEYLCFDGVSGTSAGAMNATVLAQGLMAGGNEGGREALAAYWNAVMPNMPLQVRSRMLEAGSQALLKVLSPYQFNPMDLNPLRDIVNKHIDFERLRKESPVKLFIAATRVRTGALKLFREYELDTDHLLASACLPTIHHAINIDGEDYWDGGFAGNPAVYPLVFDCSTPDVIIVLLQPIDRPDTPKSTHSISERIGEMTFGATFVREMRAIAATREQTRRSLLPIGRIERRLRSARFHIVQADELMRTLKRESKYDTRRVFLTHLFEQGREHAEEWLDKHKRDLGKRPSADIAELFL
jgi:NTE family protein